MAFNPGVSFFISFNELDPSKQNRCIFFTQRRTRCQLPCRDRDNQRAVVLHRSFKMAIDTLSIEMLREYAQRNCCGDARHRDRIEDLELLTPLAQRWLEEIRTRAINRPNAMVNNLGHSSRYKLRRRLTSGSMNTTQLQPLPTTHGALSEFRPHIAEPSPTDSVYRKLLDPLDDRDFESGALYIFDRPSSPGHVKIGWTAKAVSVRLEDWSRCGYKPNLLFSIDHIPHAQRVETLTHHELIKEWRRERRCKALWCQKSHQEWFETSREHAEQTIRNWADFIKAAEPYDINGHLKPWWKEVIEKLHRKMEALTAEKLLGVYRKMVTLKPIVVGKHVCQSRAPKAADKITKTFSQTALSQGSGDTNSSEMEQTVSSKNDDKSNTFWKLIESGIVVDSPSLLGQRAIRAEVKVEKVPAKMEHMPECIQLLLSHIDLARLFIPVPSLQCPRQNPDEAKQLSRKDVATTLSIRFSTPIPAYNLSTNSWIIPPMRVFITSIESLPPIDQTRIKSWITTMPALSSQGPCYLKVSR